MRLLGVLLVLACCAGACNGCATAGGVEPYEAKPLNPPAWFRNLHREMLECLDGMDAKVKRRSYRGVRFFVARPGVMGEYGEVMPWAGEVAGKWSWPDHITLDARFVGHPAVIRHELGHFILQDGNASHPIIELCEDGPPNPR